MNGPVGLDYLDDESETEVVNMANNIWSVMCDTEIHDPSVPASALGCVLALLMSQTSCPEATFTTALTARDRQYKELVTSGEAMEITEH